MRYFTKEGPVGAVKMFMRVRNSKSEKIIVQVGSGLMILVLAYIHHSPGPG